MYKTHQCRTTFGSWDVEKVYAFVAQSTFPSQHVQNTPASDHFWQLRCRKSARRCGAKHISKSKCTKHHMCFAPQRRALFRHLNCQKWSEAGAYSILTSKCASRHNGVHFFDISTSKSGPSMVCLYILTSKCASRHNSVQIFISHLASWLRTRRFSEPTFRPSGATNHWKNTVFRDFPIFSRICIFFLLALSLLIFSLLIFLFSLPRPCFSSVHIVGSLTSKLPSISWTFHD